jgi:hypothetical protein
MGRPSRGSIGIVWLDALAMKVALVAGVIWPIKNLIKIATVE